MIEFIKVVFTGIGSVGVSVGLFWIFLLLDDAVFEAAYRNSDTFRDWVDSSNPSVWYTRCISFVVLLAALWAIGKIVLFIVG